MQTVGTSGRTGDNYLRDIPMRHCLKRASSMLFTGHHPGLQRGVPLDKIRTRISRILPLSSCFNTLGRFSPDTCFFHEEQNTCDSEIAFEDGTGGAKHLRTTAHAKTASLFSKGRINWID